MALRRLQLRIGMRRSCDVVASVNGRELVTAYGLLRNSTKIAAQF